MIEDNKPNPSEELLRAVDRVTNMLHAMRRQKEAGAQDEGLISALEQVIAAARTSQPLLSGDGELVERLRRKVQVQPAEAVRLGLCQHHLDWLNKVAAHSVCAPGRDEMVSDALVEDLDRANAAPQVSQRKLHSAAEAIVGTIIGFLVSLAIQTLIIVPLFHLRTNGVEDVAIVLIFTVASVIRGYGVRRLFNHWHVKENSK